ncbi:MAG: hypothetical protein GX952_06915 [Firmicutes bacterium]|nr:hypothetical protein [Bacillota bacterium]
MSKVLKNPLISPQIQIVTAAEVVRAESESESESAVPSAADLNLDLERRLANVAKVMKTNLLEAAEHRAAILEQKGKEQAAKILAAARQEAEHLKQQAENEGYEKGYQAGYQAGQEKANQLIVEAKKTVQEAQAEKARLLAQTEPEALELAFELAEKILRRELTRSATVPAQLLQAAAGKLPTAEPVIIEVAPGEKQRWLDAEEMLRSALADRPFKIAENPAVPPAEFMLSSKIGTVDARLKPQLEACRAHILGDNT